jgi:hypothetical protein
MRNNSHFIYASMHADLLACSWFYVHTLLISAEKTIAASLLTRPKRDPIKPQVKFYSVDIAYKPE